MPTEKFLMAHFSRPHRAPVQNKAKGVVIIRPNVPQKSLNCWYGKADTISELLVTTCFPSYGLHFLVLCDWKKKLSIYCLLAE